MAGVRALDGAGFDDLLAKLSTISWPVSVADMPSLVEAWGWAITWIADDGDGIEADPGFGLAVDEPASLDALDGELTTVRVSTSDHLDRNEAPARDQLRDAYARQVAIARERMGEPPSKRTGELGQVTWMLASGGRIDLVCADSGCWVTATSPAHTSARRIADR